MKIRLGKMSHKFIISSAHNFRFVLISFLKGKNEVLTEVDLSWNQIRLKGAIEIAQALGKSDLSQEQLVERISGITIILELTQQILLK